MANGRLNTWHLFPVSQNLTEMKVKGQWHEPTWTKNERGDMVDLSVDKIGG